MKRLPAIALGLLAATATSAGNLSEPIFGFRLGQPWQNQLPACPLNGSVTTLCHRGGISASGHVVLNRAASRAKSDGMPEWVDETVFLRLDKAGDLTSLAVYTPGPEFQPTVIDEVWTRFGPPTSLEQREAENIYGDRWQVIRATWALPDLLITYDCSRRDRCLLVFASKKSAS